MIILEAIRNARRHAATATEVKVTLSWQPTELEIRVTDDGTGFDPEQRYQTSLGILGMRERATLIYADLDIHSEPGLGTTVTLSIRQPPRYEMS